MDRGNNEDQRTSDKNQNTYVPPIDRSILEGGLWFIEYKWGLGRYQKDQSQNPDDNGHPVFRCYKPPGPLVFGIADILLKFGARDNSVKSQILIHFLFIVGFWNRGILNKAGKMDWDYIPAINNICEIPHDRIDNTYIGPTDE